MKYKSKYDIGERIETILTKDTVDIIEVMSTDTRINKIPKLFIEFLNDNYDASLLSVRYVPNIYFELNDNSKEILC